jgi:hypothetical protein
MFRLPDHGFSIAFRSDAAGHITYIASSSAVFEQVPWYRAVALQRGLGLGGLVFLLGMLGVPFLALRRRGSLWHASGRAVQAVTLMAWLTAKLNLIFLIGLVIVLSQAYQPA